jgi:hypothetical protein
VRPWDAVWRTDSLTYSHTTFILFLVMRAGLDATICLHARTKKEKLKIKPVCVDVHLCQAVELDFKASQPFDTWQYRNCGQPRPNSVTWCWTIYVVRLLVFTAMIMTMFSGF